MLKLVLLLKTTDPKTAFRTEVWVLAKRCLLRMDKFILVDMELIDF